MRLAFRLGQRQQHIPPPSGDGRPVGQRDYDLRAHETYEQAVVGGGQGRNIVFTFMLTNSFLATAYAAVSAEPKLAETT
jgi:hypothetical protein